MGLFEWDASILWAISMKSFSTTTVVPLYGSPRLAFGSHIVPFFNSQSSVNIAHSTLNLMRWNLETSYQNTSIKLFSFLSRNPFKLQFKLQNSSYTKSNQTILNDNVIRNVKVQLGFFLVNY